MKIVHVSYNDLGGGAAKGAYIIHRALVDRMEDSLMLVRWKQSNDARVIRMGYFPGRIGDMACRVLNNVPIGPLALVPSIKFSVNLHPSGVAGQIQKLRPDVVHLHWVGNGTAGIEEIGTIGQPIVWTLRDMWPFTGGCHYSENCEKYESSCGSCPIIRSTDPSDISRKLQALKQKSWRNKKMVIVGISQWISDCARKSSIFQDCDIRTVSNAVDTETYRPVGCLEARKKLRLPEEQKIILFGALNALKDPRKGFKILTETLEVIGPRLRGVRLMIVGNREIPPASVAGLEVHGMGEIRDDRKMAQIYSAADVFVMPSTQEAFGKMAVEAIACGTPVVGFDTGGLTDIIRDDEVGYKARCFDRTDLAAGILKFVEGPAKTPAAVERRNREALRFASDTTADQYLQIYKEFDKG